MSARITSNERIAVLEQKVTHVETELLRMSAKVDDITP